MALRPHPHPCLKGFPLDICGLKVFSETRNRTPQRSHPEQERRLTKALPLQLTLLCLKRDQIGHLHFYSMPDENQIPDASQPCLPAPALRKIMGVSQAQCVPGCNKDWPRPGASLHAPEP